jgi:hypothetical protein
MQFYLGKLLSAYRDPVKAGEIIARWESSAPRPVQRIESLDSEQEQSFTIHFGTLSGTGKTTVAHECIWRNAVTSDGVVCDSGDALAVAMTGHAFARTVAGRARDLDDLMTQWIAAEWMLLDDLDKRGGKDGKFSPIVQQTIFDLVEYRTVERRPMIITLNSNGDKLLEKFDGDIGPYLLRRLRERFRSIDFDPVVQPEVNILQMKAIA